jgi:hypothetical protein
MIARQRVFSSTKRPDAVKGKARLATKHHCVTMLKSHLSGGGSSSIATKIEGDW